VSALTGAGLPELLDLLESEVPHLDALVDVVLPYGMGSLVSRIHAEGEIIGEEHLDSGTRLQARVGPALAAELANYAVV
jgi:GTP-binding protein HflX